MSSYRLRLLGLGVVLALAVATASIGIYYGNQKASNSTISNGNNPFIPAPQPATALGVLSTLDQARQSVGANFSSPTSLPTGTTQSQVRVREGAMAILFENPTLASLGSYSSGKIIIFILKDNTTYHDPSTIVSNQIQTGVIVENGTTRTVTAPVTTFTPIYQLVTVSGHHGWAINPTTFSNGVHESGRLDWWAGAVHYSIVAELPANTLIQMADSMHT